MIAMRKSINKTTLITNLYKDFRKDLLAFTLRRCGDKATAKDIIQEVFVKLWLKSDELNEITNLRSYILVMIRNETTDYLRRRDLYHKMLNGYELHSCFSTINDSVLENEYRERLIAAISKLPPHQSLAFELRCVYNWNVSRVASVMDISPLTVKNHIQTVRRKLMAMVA